MWTLYRKEISTFFTSLTGWLAVVVFLVLQGLLLWVFKGSYNITDNGFAAMDGLFASAPLLYLFLIPAITMRMFAEEKRAGTMELLLTKPIGEGGIVMAKYLAGVTLVAVTLLPTLVYYVTVYRLGSPAGNIDSGSVAGSYVGLLLIGAAFVAMGLLASVLTNNQIVAFIVAALLCAAMYLGFEGLYHLGIFGEGDLAVRQLGMLAHYESISRGVVDTRDVFYYLGVAVLALMGCRMVLQSRKWRR